ncbi:MAG: hypothetical protein V1744_00125 [Candidatus Altiarchaeota archaeon]
MAPQKTCSDKVLAVVEALRAEREIGLSRLEELVGDSKGEVANLMERLSYAKLVNDSLVATPHIDGKATPEEVALVGEYLLGSSEAPSYRRLMDSLLPNCPTPPFGGAEQFPPQNENKIKVEVDPEVVKKYAKEYLDVKEIADRQKLQKGGGK